MTMGESKNNTKRLIGKPSGTLIICILLLFIAAISGFGFTQMQTSSGSGDSARTANFVVAAQAVADGTEMKINCNDTDQDLIATYLFSVSNTDGSAVSEMDAAYNLTVTLNTELPEGITVNIDGIPGVIDTNRKSISFSNSWIMQARSVASNTHTLTFTAEPGLIAENSEIGFVVRLHTEQIN